MGAVAGVTRVVLADDDALVRAGLRMILGADPTIEVCAEAADGAEAVAAVGRERPDVLLLDIRMPRVDGLAALTRLRAAGSPVRVLVLTTFDADDLVLAALRRGADGFLLKDTPPPRLVEAVHRVAAGQPMLSPSVTTQLIAAATAPQHDARRAAARERMSRLTEREREVALAVGRGLSNAEIAGELYLGLATVKTHVGRLFHKLGVTNRVQIALVVHDAEG
ncbi:response regulator transcription factor [Georgenia sp. TF02-10]|uniref:response regulator n=1 Tax=Georgenia sp. TF02-10 TaxID=2917725 RepID=UPI001FA7BC98|nr:response regulator transcription factor [Georgenia sp. TF02-10]UNX55016.1 response regulator transcription factor [Georgenia sp. TF02-10]